MKFSVKKGGGIGFARKESYEYEGVKYEADLKDGDTIKILDAGMTEQGNYGEQQNFKIKTRNGEKKLAFNQSTINVMVLEFGEDSENWVGKDVKVILQKKLIAGKKSIIPYLVVKGWSLDEYGELVKEGQTGSAQQIADNEAPF
jgi:hypothetical protein